MATPLAHIEEWDMIRRPDNELVKQLAAGDEEAFCELYACYWKKLCNFCSRFLESYDLAENYAQDIFMKIWENRELLDQEKSFSSYLYTIARNKVLNYLRHVARSETLSRKYIQTYSDSPEYEPECGEELLEKDYFALLRQAILRLSPRQRQVFCMSRNGNMTHKEIAERLGLSVYTIQEYMSDSLKSIKDYVSKHSDIIFPLLLIFFNLH